MPIDRHTLLNWRIPDVAHTYDVRDTMLYALGLGAGDCADELAFVYERGLLSLPMMAVVLGYPGLWVAEPGTGVNWKQMLHGEQGLELFEPLPTSGTVIGRTRVVDLIDKGTGKGAVLLTARDVVEADTGKLLCTLTSTSLLRGDGGFDGQGGVLPQPKAVPERPPDLVVQKRISPRAALIYRLSGDYNPLHVDSEVASDAGLSSPILHGLCTFGMAGLALVKSYCCKSPSALRKLSARFSAPVFPGETLSTEIWREGGNVSFRSTAVERNVLVLNNGTATLDT